MLCNPPPPPHCPHPPCVSFPTHICHNTFATPEHTLTHNLGCPGALGAGAEPSEKRAQAMKQAINVWAIKHAWSPVARLYLQANHQVGLQLTLLAGDSLQPWPPVGSLACPFGNAS